MRIAVVGAGGLGGFFGGLLARGGAKVTLLARGAHLQAMQHRGLTVKSQVYGEFTVQATALEDPGQVGPVDLVLFCVKAYDLETAAHQCRPLIQPETMVIPVQNGIDIADRLGSVWGEGRVLGGLTYVASRIEGPGIVTQRGTARELVFGELAGHRGARAERLLAFFHQHGMAAELRTDMRFRLWEKFAAICATGGVLALTRLPFGPVLSTAETRALMSGVIEEVAALARAQGIDLPAGTGERLCRFLQQHMDPQAKSSQLTDLEAGRRLELESINGAAVRLGKRFGISTPLNFAVYAALKPYADGRPPGIPDGNTCASQSTFTCTRATPGPPAGS